MFSMFLLTAEPAETKAVFKTLFQSLTPCRQEGKQSKDTGMVMCVIL